MRHYILLRAKEGAVMSVNSLSKLCVGVGVAITLSKPLHARISEPWEGIRDSLRGPEQNGGQTISGVIWDVFPWIFIHWLASQSFRVWFHYIIYMANYGMKHFSTIYIRVLEKVGDDPLHFQQWGTCTSPSRLPIVDAHVCCENKPRIISWR